MTKPTDPLYGNQWHLAQIGNLERVWDFYTGQGVTVVVYDDGVEATHEDLNDNYVSGGTFTYGGITYGSTPLSPSDGHGTAVAGLIAAEANNGKGGVGVSWGAEIASLNFLEEVVYAPEATILASIQNAANFDVMNNSWGFEPLYQPIQSLSVPGSQSSLLAGAFEDVSQSGRGGLGTIIVNSAGNEGSNANGEGITASRHTIAVAATDEYGNVTSYSNWGANILVSAPDAAYTTDRSGDAGYNATGTSEILGPDPLPNTNYTSIFGGTSAAAPIVSGVVALMLEANPNLGWRDVHNILALTASHTGSALSSGPTGFELSRWEVANSGTWNGGGMGFHTDYGYGMVNAFAAVSMAEMWSVMFGPAQTSANEVTIRGSSVGSQAINDFGYGPTFAQADVIGNIEVETVMVTVSLTHSWASDLVLTLIAPDYSEFTLMRNEGSTTLMDTGFTWTFAVEGARGLSSAGTWQLRIDDEFSGYSGVLNSFSVDIYGSAQKSYDVHTFTDDFLMYRNHDGFRANIKSMSPFDWLNFSAVTGNVVATLYPGSTISVSGTYWATLNGGSEFAQIITGSGNDRITGANQGADIIYTGIGNDIARGLDGNDSMDGGRGNDTLYGGRNSDTLLGGDGSDLVDGGDGRDLAYLGLGNDIFDDVAQNGVNGSDTVFGGRGDDTINGDGGDDYFSGETGFDSLSGGIGRDTLDGGSEADTLKGGDDDDSLVGGAGNDYLVGGSQSDTLWGGDGDDVVNGGNGRDRAFLGAGNDVFVDNGQNDVNGRDTVYGGVGDDTINGDGGDDAFYGEAGADSLVGGNGNDTLDGGDQADILWGGDGDDLVAGGNGRDRAFLGNGNDIFSDSAQHDVNGRDTVFGGAGNDTINGDGSNDTFFGEDGNDSLVGGIGDDTLFGGNQADTIWGGDGNDLVNGGNGCDLAYLGAGSDIFVDNGQNDANGHDTVYGEAGNDTINGGGGNDIFDGGDDDDELTGGIGDDILTGGAGSDSFVFLDGCESDRVTDFLDDVDALVFDDMLWGGGLTVLEVISAYASIIVSDTVFAFGNGNTVTIEGVTSLSLFDNDIVFV